MLVSNQLVSDGIEQIAQQSVFSFMSSLNTFGKIKNPGIMFQYSLRNNELKALFLENE